MSPSVSSAKAGDQRAAPDSASRSARLGDSHCKNAALRSCASIVVADGWNSTGRRRLDRADVETSACVKSHGLICVAVVRDRATSVGRIVVVDVVRDLVAESGDDSAIDTDIVSTVHFHRDAHRESRDINFAFAYWRTADQTIIYGRQRIRERTVARVGCGDGSTRRSVRNFILERSHAEQDDAVERYGGFNRRTLCRSIVLQEDATVYSFVRNERNF